MSAYRQTPIIALREKLVASVSNIFGDVKLPQTKLAFALAA